MSEVTPIIMFGAAGRMGRMILQLAAEQPERYPIAGAVDRAGHPDEGKPLSELVPGGPADVVLSATPPDELPEGTVAIHFTLPEPTLSHLAWTRKMKVPTVVGTTGFDEAQLETLRAAGEDCPLLLTPNTSLGVNVLLALARQATRMLGPDYDVEIVEMHHHHKKDAPSGTARRLGEVICEERRLSYEKDVRHGREGNVGARPQNEVGMHALRGGDVIGDHTVVLAGPNERIELTHKAASRALFASGALQAAEWARTQGNGFYTMQDMLGL